MFMINCTFFTYFNHRIRTRLRLSLLLLLFFTNAFTCDAIGGGSPSTGTQSHHPYDHNKDLDKLKTHPSTSTVKIIPQKISSSLNPPTGRSIDDEIHSDGSDDGNTYEKSKVRMIGLKDGYVRHSSAIDNVVTNILEVSEVLERSSVLDFDKDRK